MLKLLNSTCASKKIISTIKQGNLIYAGYVTTRISFGKNLNCFKKKKKVATEFGYIVKMPSSVFAMYIGKYGIILIEGCSYSNSTWFVMQINFRAALFFVCLFFFFTG